MMLAPATSNTGTSRNVAALPALPNDANLNPRLLSRLQAVIERIATLDGQRGDALDAAVTKRDLLDSGIAITGHGGSLRPAPVDTSGWGTIPYLDSMPTPSTPEVKALIGANMLQWSMPNARGIGATEILRRVVVGEGEPGGTPVILGSVVGGMFSDIPVDYDTLYAYKIRYVSERGVPGDWSEEVQVRSLKNPSDVVDAVQQALLSSEIATQLFSSLNVGGFVENYVSNELARFTYRSLIDGKKAGFGLSNDGKVSEFAVMADKFFVIQDGDSGDPAVPFSVVDGKVYINTALIKEASISVAQIAELNATVANLVNLYVQNVVVGGDIQSSDFESGVRGWKLYQSGNAELNSAVFRGTLDVKSASSGERVEITNLGLKVYDAQGNMRVNIGVLTT